MSLYKIFLLIILSNSLTNCALFTKDESSGGKKSKDPFRLNTQAYSNSGKLNIILMMDPLVSVEYLPELLNERMKGFFYSLKEHTEYQAYVTTPSMASKGIPITQQTDLSKIDFGPLLTEKNSHAGPRLSKTLHLYDEGIAQNFFQKKQDLIIVIVSTKDDTHWSMPQVLGPLRETWPADLKTMMDLKDKLKQTEHSLRLITFVPHGNCLHKWQIASRLMYASSLNYFGDIKGDEWKESADSVDLCSLDFQQFFISLNEEIKYRE